MTNEQGGLITDGYNEKRRMTGLLLFLHSFLIKVNNV
jgi:hypothetical protein